MRHEVTVIGAGFSGLVTAFHLVQGGVRVRIIDRASVRGADPDGEHRNCLVKLQLTES